MVKPTSAPPLPPPDDPLRREQDDSTADLGETSAAEGARLRKKAWEQRKKPAEPAGKPGSDEDDRAKEK